MGTEYELSRELQEEINAIVFNNVFTEFEPLREHDITVSSCLKIKLNKDSEPVPIKGPAAQLVKFNDLTKLFTDKQYVIAVDGYFWQHADMVKKRASLHKALMQIEIIPTADGAIKLAKRKPDINEFAATIIRYGPPVSEAINRILPLLIEAGQQVAQVVTGTSSTGSTVDELVAN